MGSAKNVEGTVFNIQRFSLHDGPGIRTTAFLKGCPLKCFWCQNPESQKMMPEIFLYKENCTHCDKCVSICPTGANDLFGDISEIDRSKCVGCGKCIEVCSYEARKLAGKCLTVDEVIQEVVRDGKFYENSGGGLTLSGGEPTAQPEFALALLENCKDLGIHTVLETCGYASWPALEQLLEYTDLVLYDIKCVDNKRHYGATGKSNELILENAKRTAQTNPMIVRVPMVPGFNDSKDEVLQIASFVKEELGPIEIELLRYNKWGEIKYERLGRKSASLEEQEDDYFEELNNIVRKELKGADSMIHKDKENVEKLFAR